MAKVIFTNQTVDAESDEYVVDGLIHVHVSGLLDGADVKTLAIDDAGIVSVVRSCSWLSSLADQLGIAGEQGDVGYEHIARSKIKFKIENAGAATSINLSLSKDTWGT